MGKTLLVLGGYGMAGRALVALLLSETDVQLVLAGRSREKAEQVATSLNERYAGQRVIARQADAADGMSLARAFQGIDLVLVASSTLAHTKTVVCAALEAGIDYLDIQYASNRWSRLQEFAPQAKGAGLCFVTEAGFHPGLAAAAVRYLAQSMDETHEATVAVIMNQEGGFPYSAGVEELILEFRDYKAEVFANGAWRKARLWTMGDNKVVDFGPPFGRRSCTPMTLSEMHGLPALYPSLRQVGHYVAGFNWFADWVVMPTVLAAVRLWPQRALKPMARLFCWATRVFAAPPYGLVLKAEVSGLKGRQPATVSITISHADGYKLTAIPVVAYLQQYLDGSARKPGLHMMGYVVDPARMVEDMRRMGAGIRV